MKHPFILEAYTRSQAIQEGLLIDVSQIASSLGFAIPVALSRAAWAACIEWTPNGKPRAIDPELAERLRELLQQCMRVTMECASSWESDYRFVDGGLSFPVQCGTHHSQPIQLTLNAAFPFSRDDELGITIMLPDEF